MSSNWCMHAHYLHRRLDTNSKKNKVREITLLFPQLNSHSMIKALGMDGSTIVCQPHADTAIMCFTQGS